MMRAFAIAALFLTAGLCACTDFPDKDVTTCGNGVIDRGEGCDSRDPLCVHCQLRCPDHTDDACLPAGAGYRCGGDDFCHAPSGVFWRDEAPSSFAFPVGQGTVADLDGDRIGDVVGFSDINIEVRWGDLETQLADRTTVVVPFTNTAATIRTIPGYRDATNTYVPPASDILLPTQDGIASFTARGHQLVSYPFANAPGERGDCATFHNTATPIATFSLDKHHLALVARDNSSHAVEVAVYQPAIDECSVAPQGACGLLMDQDPAGMTPPTGGLLYDHYPLPSTGTVKATSIIAISFPSADMMTARTCVLRFVHDAVTPTPVYTFTTLTPTPISGTPGPITLARADTTGVCPSLFTPDAGGVQGVAATLSAPCGFQNPGSPQQLPTSPGQLPVGRVALVPPIASRAPDALAIATPEMFTGTTAFYTLSNVTQLSPMYTSPRPLYPVLSADIDGDGIMEAVGIVPPQSIGGAPDIDILYRAFTQPVQTFVPYRISTQSVPTHLEIGDFDGNASDDIAFTERIGTEERLLIAYGTHDRPLDPVEIAGFHNVGALCRVDLPDSIEPTGEALDDLIVADLVPQPVITVLHGNPQRSMFAFYDPRGASDSRFVSAIAGNFDTRDPALDVMAFEQRTTNACTIGNVAYPTTVWVAPGFPTDQGLSDVPKNYLATGIGAETCAPNQLCLQGAQLTPWHLDGRDVLIAANRPVPSDVPLPAVGDRRFYVIDPMAHQDATCPSSAKVQVLTVPASTITLAPHQAAASMWGADIDGDGSANLVVSLASVPQASLGTEAEDQVLDCQVDGTGMPTSCTSIVDEVPELAGYNCRAAETAAVSYAGRLDPVPPSNAAEILVLCKHVDVPDGTVFRVRREDKDGALHAVAVLDGASDYLFISVGDINGDAVADFAGISFDKMGIPHVSLHPQCAADDTSCIDANKRTPPSTMTTGAGP